MKNQCPREIQITKNSSPNKKKKKPCERGERRDLAAGEPTNWYDHTSPWTSP